MQERAVLLLCTIRNLSMRQTSRTGEVELVETLACPELSKGCPELSKGGFDSLVGQISEAGEASRRDLTILFPLCTEWQKFCSIYTTKPLPFAAI